MQIVEIGEPVNNEESIFAVGIDFGTTNSLIAISQNNQITCFKTASGSDLLPSVVSYLAEGKKLISLVGDRTKDNSIISVKRLLAKSYSEISDDPSLKALCENLLTQQDNLPKISLNNNVFSIPKVASEIFTSLKNSAEKELGHPIEKVVVSVPAYFNDAERGQVLLAAKLAGLEVIRLIAEPTAAAYAYGLNKKSEGTYLVYDLGGGTFDVSILHMQAGVLQVIACGGDNNLGGDNIDFALATYLAEQFQFTQEVGSSLISIAKKAKEDLSSVEQTKVYFLEKEISINKLQFEQIIMELIDKTIKITKDVHFEAEKIDIEGIIMVGGSTRIPIIKQKLKQAFKVRIFDDIDPDRAVVMGAALQAENLTTKKDTLLIDVLPLSLGLELYGGLAEKIILRNTPIPFSISREFATYADNQTGMKFLIVQGEREMAKDCRPLASFELKGLPTLPAGRVKVEVTFAIDADGILSVTARDAISGKAADIEVKPSFGLDELQINKDLEDAFANVAVDHHAKLLVETKIEAMELISGLNKAITDTPDILEEKELKPINSAIKALQKVVNEDNREKIISKTQDLNKLAACFIEKHLNFGADKILLGKNIKEFEG